MSYFVDLHCHLDLYPDFEAQVQLCEDKQIYTLAVTTVPAAWPRNKKLMADKKFVRPALGLHPQLVNDKKAKIEDWDCYLEDAKYIGEIGLDAGPKFYPFFDKQVVIFSHILSRCAQMGGKILTVHSVRCARLVLDHIERTGAHRNNKIILHWFTGTVAEAKRAATMGCYFSVNSQMLSSPRALELLMAIPKNRMLTETDGPFIHEAGKPIQPGSVQPCIMQLAIMLNLDSMATKNQVYQNFVTLLI